MHRLVEVRVLDGYRLQLVFQDGVHVTVDLNGLAGRGVIAFWNDRARFEEVAIGPAGELRWGDEIDLCPDSLYLRVTGKAPADVFRSLRGEAAHA